MTGQWMLLPVIAIIPLAMNLSVVIQTTYFKYTRRRYGEGRRIFKMAPLHHHFELSGWSETQIVQRFWLISLVAAHHRRCLGFELTNGLMGCSGDGMDRQTRGDHWGGEAGSCSCPLPVARGAQVILNDKRPAEKLLQEHAGLQDLPVSWVLGGHPEEILDGADLVCPSGGVPLTLPLVVEAQRRGILLSNDSQIFLEAVPCRVIGITGSAGKTTTTTLVGRMAEAAVQEGGAAGRGSGSAGISVRRWSRWWMR